jgi:pimeloyl-ACP methyl ester carboxylesterase
MLTIEKRKSASKRAKDTVLFLPGLNCTGALFQPQIDAISDTKHCVVADHGSADSFENIVSSILRDSPERFSIVGLSMGGYLAFEIMRQQPERVSAMILLDTRATPDAEEDAERRRRTIDVVERGQFEALHAILWPRLVHPARAHNQNLESVVKTMMRDTGPDRFIRQQTAILNRPDYMPILSTINVPVLVGVGRQDIITPPEMSEIIASAIPEAMLSVFEDCGHLPTLEKPEILARTIIEFLHQK